VDEYDSKMNLEYVKQVIESKEHMSDKELQNIIFWLDEQVDAFDKWFASDAQKDQAHDILRGFYNLVKQYRNEVAKELAERVLFQ